MIAPPIPSQGIPVASQPYTLLDTQLHIPIPPVPQLSATELAARQEAQRIQAESFARASELRQILDNLERVDDEGRRSSLLDTLCSTEDVLGLPVHPNPPGIQSSELKVNLLKHQARINNHFCK